MGSFINFPKNNNKMTQKIVELGEKESLALDWVKIQLSELEVSINEIPQNVHGGTMKNDISALFDRTYTDAYVICKSNPTLESYTNFLDIAENLRGRINVRQPEDNESVTKSIFREYQEDVKSLVDLRVTYDSAHLRLLSAQTKTELEVAARAFYELSSQDGLIREKRSSVAGRTNGFGINTKLVLINEIRPVAETLYERVLKMDYQNKKYEVPILLVPKVKQPPEVEHDTDYYIRNSPDMPTIEPELNTEENIRDASPMPTVGYGLDGSNTIPAKGGR